MTTTGQPPRCCRTTSACTTCSPTEAGPAAVTSCAIAVLILGNSDVRISYVVADTRRRSTATRSATRSSSSRAASATLQSVFGELEVRQGDNVVIPRVTIHRWIPDRRREERPAAALLRRGQRATSTPPDEVPSAGTASSSRGRRSPSATCACRRRSCWRTPTRPTRTPRSTSSTAAPAGVTGSVVVYDHHPFDVVGWDGQLYPYAFNYRDFAPVTGELLQPPPTYQVFEGQGFVDLQLRPASAGVRRRLDQGALLPLQRRLRRGDVLLRRRDRGPGGIGHPSTARCRCIRPATPTARDDRPT